MLHYELLRGFTNSVVWVPGRCRKARDPTRRPRERTLSRFRAPYSMSQRYNGIYNGIGKPPMSQRYNGITYRKVLSILHCELFRGFTNPFEFRSVGTSEMQKGIGPHSAPARTHPVSLLCTAPVGNLLLLLYYSQA